MGFSVYGGGVGGSSNWGGNMPTYLGSRPDNYDFGPSSDSNNIDFNRRKKDKNKEDSLVDANANSNPPRLQQSQSLSESESPSVSEPISINNGVGSRLSSFVKGKAGIGTGIGVLNPGSQVGSLAMNPSSAGTPSTTGGLTGNISSRPGWGPAIGSPEYTASMQQAYGGRRNYSSLNNTSDEPSSTPTSSSRYLSQQNQAIPSFGSGPTPQDEDPLGQFIGEASSEAGKAAGFAIMGAGTAGGWLADRLGDIPHWVGDRVSDTPGWFGNQFSDYFSKPKTPAIPVPGVSTPVPVPVP